MDDTALAHGTSSRFILPSSLHSAGTSTTTDTSAAPAVADETPPPFQVLGIPEQTSRAGADTTGRDLASRAMAHNRVRPQEESIGSTYLQVATGGPPDRGQKARSTACGAAANTGFPLVLMVVQLDWMLGTLYIYCVPHELTSGHM